MSNQEARLYTSLYTSGLGSLGLLTATPSVSVRPSGETVKVLVRMAFLRACEAAGVERARFHDLRHTAATRMAGAGAPLVDIKAVLGHANINQTARYAHSTDDGKRRAVEAIAEAAGHNLGTDREREAV